MSETFNLVVVSAGHVGPVVDQDAGRPDAQRVAAVAAERGSAVRTRVIDLRELASDITTALTSQLVTPRLQQAVDALGAADGLIAAAPVYKAGAERAVHLVLPRARQRPADRQAGGARRHGGHVTARACGR